MYLTRNQAYRKVPWVRIPPLPPIPARAFRYENSSKFFLIFGSDRLFTDCGTKLTPNPAPANATGRVSLQSRKWHSKTLAPRWPINLGQSFAFLGVGHSAGNLAYSPTPQKGLALHGASCLRQAPSKKGALQPLPCGGVLKRHPLRSKVRAMFGATVSAHT
jgi:hypothetical protein